MIQMDQAISTDNPENSNNIDDKNIITSFDNLAPNEVGSSWHVFSLLSWIIFISALFNLLFGNQNGLKIDTPLYIDHTLVTIFLLVINIMGLIWTIKRTIYDKDQGFMNVFFGEQIKQQAFGFLFGAGAMISLRSIFDYINFVDDLLEIKSRKSYYETYFDFAYSLLGINLSLSIIGYSCLIYSYSKIKQQSEWYEIMIIKKGAYSASIGFLFYSMCFSSVILGLLNNSDSEGVSVSFTIVVSFFNIVYSFSQKDIGIAITNLIINISLSSVYCYFGKTAYKAEMIISLCFMSITFILILYLIFSMRDKIINA